MNSYLHFVGSMKIKSTFLVIGLTKVQHSAGQSGVMQQARFVVFYFFLFLNMYFSRLLRVKSESQLFYLIYINNFQYFVALIFRRVFLFNIGLK